MEQVNKEAKNQGMDFHFSLEDAKEAIAAYFAEFKVLKKWIDDNKQKIQKHGYVYSYFGRKRRLPNVLSTDRSVQGHAVRSGINFLVQSPASDVNLIGAIEMNDIIKKKKMKTKIFALVHDSILAEVPDEEIADYKRLLTECIQKDRGISLPGHPIGCDFDIGEDYSFGKFEEKYGKELAGIQ